MCRCGICKQLKQKVKWYGWNLQVMATASKWVKMETASERFEAENKLTFRNQQVLESVSNGRGWKLRVM